MNRATVTATLFSVVGFAILIGLGVWQLERKAWKENLIADLNARLSASPQPLPASPSQAQDEYRRVKVRAQFAGGTQALVYTSGSALRPDVTGAGYWVMAPAKVDGTTVVINRGYITPEVSKAIGPAPLGDIEIVGALRWPDEGGAFTPRDEPQNNVWYRRAPVTIAAIKNWGGAAPFYIEQELPQLSGAPRAGPLVVHLPNNHLQYAITWFGLAAALAGVYLVWLRGRLRRAGT